MAKNKCKIHQEMIQDYITDEERWYTTFTFCGCVSRIMSLTKKTDAELAKVAHKLMSRELKKRNLIERKAGQTDGYKDRKEAYHNTNVQGFIP